MGRRVGESFGISVDRAGYVKRECGQCNRVFKVRGGELDGLAVQRALARKLPHVNEGEIDDVPSERFCPYCGESAPEDAFLTSEQRAQVEKRADHWQREVRYTQLSHPRRTLGQNPYVTFLPVAPEPFKRESEARGAELRPFPLLCCREDIGLGEGWSGEVTCHFCGTVHEVPRTAPGFAGRLDLTGFEF